MAQIKLRIELNKGRTGAPLDKLGEIARQLERFLRSLADDISIETKKGEWLAVNFKNGSVTYDASFQGDVSESRFSEFNRLIGFISDFDPDTESANALVSDATLLEYARIGEHIDPDETVGIGMYNPSGHGRIKWRQITYRKTSSIRQAIETPILSYGSIQGLMHSLNLLGNRPFFQIREHATNTLVRCLYGNNLYPQIVEALRERNAVVHATGHMSLDRAKQTVSEMNVDRIDKVEPLTDGEFLGLFGSAPGLTGEMTTQEFIDQMRGDG